MLYQHDSGKLVEAFLWTGDENQLEEPEWIVSALKEGTVEIKGKGDSLHMSILDTGARAFLGEYIVLGDDGVIFSVSPDVFSKKFTLVDTKETIDMGLSLSEIPEPVSE